MHKITPFIMFNDQADEAVKLYLSIFKHAEVRDVNRYGEGGPGPAGTIMSATLELEGQTFLLYNGGPHFTFTDGVSLFVSCKDQAEVDELWEKLSAGGEQGPCGWLKDKFGLSWQIIPTILPELLGDPDPKRSSQALQAMLKMSKIDIAALKAAADQP